MNQTPADAKDVYTIEKYIVQCDHFVQATFHDRLRNVADTLFKKYGHSKPDKIAFVAQLIENEQERKLFFGLYEKATELWNKALGIFKETGKFSKAVSDRRNTF
jgi:hypothetical protein